MEHNNQNLNDKEGKQNSKLLPHRHVRRFPENFTDTETDKEETFCVPNDVKTHDFSTVAEVFSEQADYDHNPNNEENDANFAGDDSQTAPVEEDKTNEEPQLLSKPAAFFDWIKTFLFSLITVIFVFTLLFRCVTVDGNSMLPTLNDKDYLIISDLFYTPKTGDIVVVQSPLYKNGKEPIIKRVIACEGQTVGINFKTWQVWVDGVELEEDYILRMNGLPMNPENIVPDETGYAEVEVRENCIFVMGDNRNDSLDSRDDDIGQIDVRYSMGKLILRAAPISRFGIVK